MTRIPGHPARGIDRESQAESALRGVLETQPLSLLRLARDTTFLAVNEAGLAALGADRLDQVLGRHLSDLLPAEERPVLHVFVHRVISGYRGSIEVDVIRLTGERHTVEVHATAHPGSPDGIESILASLRDVTESRRLEQSLIEAVSRQIDQEAAHESERLRLMSELERARSGKPGSEAAGRRPSAGRKRRARRFRHP